MGWWTVKVRQAERHVRGRVSPVERHALETWLAPAQLALFDSMHRADQRHGLDVVGLLRAEGHGDDDELLLAALLHDCAKGPGVGLPIVSHGRSANATVSGCTTSSAPCRASGTPSSGCAITPRRPRRLAREAGCSERTAELIRHQAAPVDPVAGRALQLADEAC